MKKRFNKRRLAVFGALTLAAASGMCAFAYIGLRPMLEVKPWQAWLGHAEQASLNETMSPLAEDPDSDPVLKIPGLVLDRGARNLTETMESTLFRAHVLPTKATDIYAGIAAYWLDQGLKVEPTTDKSMLKGTNPAGDSYSALWNESTGPDGLVVIWRTRTLNGGINSNHSAQQWPEQYQGIFPPIPAGPNVMESGRPGYPGYCVMVSTGTDPEAAYHAMTQDMARRGWLPLHGELEKSLAVQLNSHGKDIYTMVYRHSEAPFGCQILVERDPNNVHSSQVMLALF